jgi:general secretion pathway protein N
MRKSLLWSLAGFASITLTLLVFFPANWVATIVENQSAGRLTLGDAHGTLWRGSAFIGVAAGDNDPVTPLLPGRFSWSLSPLLLVGSVDAELENEAALSQTIRLNGNWHQWQVSQGAFSLPAERLAAWGAPLNTVQPAGQMRLSWDPLQLTLRNGKIELIGKMSLAITDLASRMSPVRPLGSYDLAVDWHGTEASVKLMTTQGPMLLNGSGKISDGHLQFSGSAEAQAGQEQRLENFLNLLGQNRREGDKNIITIEFK